MRVPASMLLVATLVLAMGAAVVTEVHAQPARSAASAAAPTAVLGQGW